MTPHAHLVLSYNHPQLTQNCLIHLMESASPQSIFLLHNGSSKDCIAKLENLFPNIHHLIIDTNAGFSAGANFGISLLFNKNIDWIYFHTNDTKTIMLPNCLLELLAPGIYAPLILKRQTKQVDSIGGFLNTDNQKPFHCKSTNEFSSLYAHYQLGLSPLIPYIPGTAFLINRSCWLDVGPFDENYHTYWEDIDWSYRALKQSIYLGTLSKWIIQHGIGKTCHKKSFYTQELFPKNRLKFFSKFNL